MTMQMENLFGTPIIVDSLYVTADIARSPLTALHPRKEEIVQVTDLGMGRRANGPWPAYFNYIVDHIIGAANRSTLDSRTPQMAVDWTLALSTHVGCDRAPMPIRYDSFWTALHVLALNGAGQGVHKLEIYDPRLPMTMSEDPNLRLRMNVGPSSACYEPKVEFELSIGSMILFPSWLDVRYACRRIEGNKFAFLRACLIAPVT